jgi:predicted transposase YdaD
MLYQQHDIEIARNMKQKGYPVADISELTGLSEAEIERL